MASVISDIRPDRADALLMLADGTFFRGCGFGATGETTGEVCFNTSMTGYQEILTDPSYSGQIVTFTFPHIGNVGANEQDHESALPVARGLIVRNAPTAPSNWRARQSFDLWLAEQGLTGISGIDTRALVRHLRTTGAQNGLICHTPGEKIDMDDLRARAAAIPSMNGLDLARAISCKSPYPWTDGGWSATDKAYRTPSHLPLHVVVIDYGVKRNILRCLVDAGCRLTVVPATTSAEDIIKLGPDGIFLSNGPGDPAATGVYAVPVIQKLIRTGLPIFGICLGHQMLAIALGAKTRKMPFGHRGGNHPVKDLTTGQVEITSQNHGFEVVAETLPDQAEVTHISLFDGSNEGLRLKGRPVFSVQYHPEAAPGPEDSRHLFHRFVQNLRQAQQVTA